MRPFQEMPLLGGGRILGAMGGGFLYETASLREKREQVDSLANSEHDRVPAGAYVVKSSVESTRITNSQATHEFRCDGCMFKHTVLSWQDAALECYPAHTVPARTEEPAMKLTFQHLIEDSLPFECDTYWKTIWVKCEACHLQDLKFMECAKSPQRNTRGAGARTNNFCNVS